MRLKDEIIAEIRENSQARRALMDVHEVAETSVMRWLRENHTMLCHKSSLNVICAHLKKEEEEIIIMEECDYKPVV